MEHVTQPENSSPQLGVYEHYKSTPKNRKLYQLIGIARHTETDEPLVIYIPLYTDPENVGLRLQARPLDMFMSTVEVDGITVRRFNFLGLEL